MRLGTWAGAALAIALFGCGGGGKGADSPGTCPDGTVLKGSDCVPSDDSSSSSSSSSDSSGSTATTKKGSDDDSSGGGGGGGGSGGGAASGGDDSSGGKVDYDKDAVDVQLKRAARQVKGNCGAATDDNGQATGPWGSTKASVVLGRNGRVKQVTVPSPYDGKPVGLCVINAFKKIQFPPYAGASDTVVDWDIEIVQPKK